MNLNKPIEFTKQEQFIIKKASGKYEISKSSYNETYEYFKTDHYLKLPVNLFRYFYNNNTLEKAIQYSLVYSYLMYRQERKIKDNEKEPIIITNDFLANLFKIHRNQISNILKDFESADLIKITRDKPTIRHKGMKREARTKRIFTYINTDFFKKESSRYLNKTYIAIYLNFMHNSQLKEQYNLNIVESFIISIIKTKQHQLRTLQDIKQYDYLKHLLSILNVGKDKKKQKNLISKYLKHLKDMKLLNSELVVNTTNYKIILDYRENMNQKEVANQLYSNNNSINNLIASIIVEPTNYMLKQSLAIGIVNNYKYMCSRYIEKIKKTIDIQENKIKNIIQFRVDNIEQIENLEKIKKDIFLIENDIEQFLINYKIIECKTQKDTGKAQGKEIEPQEQEQPAIIDIETQKEILITTHLKKIETLENVENYKQHILANYNKFNLGTIKELLKADLEIINNVEKREQFLHQFEIKKGA